MTSQPVRADAVRNRQKILAAARDSFAEEGTEASLDAIARRAGVGPGTLYRHFPNRDALIAELLASELGDLAQTFASLKVSALSPEDRLDSWATALVRYMTSYAGLPEPLRAAMGGRKTPLSLRCEVVIGWTEELVDAARRAGLVKDFVTGREFYRAVLGVAWAASDAGTSDAGSVEAMLRINRNGWRADASETPE